MYRSLFGAHDLRFGQYLANTNPLLPRCSAPRGFRRSYDTVALGVILSIMNAALVGLAAFQVRMLPQILILDIPPRLDFVGCEATLALTSGGGRPDAVAHERMKIRGACLEARLCALLMACPAVGAFDLTFVTHARLVFLPSVPRFVSRVTCVSVCLTLCPFPSSSLMNNFMPSYGSDPVGDEPVLQGEIRRGFWSRRQQKVSVEVQRLRCPRGVGV